MTIEINGENKRLGLALSGGGFRAAAFHLGVFRELKRLGLLWNIDLLTCVSGGSIAGGALVANWGLDEALDSLQNYLSTRSIAVSSFIGGIVDPFESRVDKLADSYNEDLFHGANLNSLKSGPRIYFNATNLTTGNLFAFVAGGNELTEMGEHELGFQQENAGSQEIATAVAASSAFPPVFPPLNLSRKIYEYSETEYVTLTDGGVYDNLGVNPLFTQTNELDYAIVSDGGKPFSVDETPTNKDTVVLKESIGILMEQVRGLQFDRLVMRHNAATGPKPLWFSIDSKEGEASTGDAAAASRVDTNLKKIDEDTLAMLQRHGAGLVLSRIERYAPELYVRELI